MPGDRIPHSTIAHSGDGHRTQQEIPVARNIMQWNMVNHDRGTGCWKVVMPANGACAPIKPAKLRGAWEWLKRSNGRQVTMDLVNGKVWCEQQ